MWQELHNTLYKKFEFADFKSAFTFMEEVAELADAMDHHPKWTNVYNVVEIWLSTHDAGNTVTEKDRTLAAQIDSINPA